MRQPRKRAPLSEPTKVDSPSRNCSFALRMNRTAWGLFLGLGLLGCHASPKQAFSLSPTHLPVITQHAFPLPPPLRQDSIHGVWPHFVGRFSVTDSLVLAQPLAASAADWLHDFAAMQAAADSSTLNTDGLELLVDPHCPLVYQKAVPQEFRPRFPAQRVLPVYVVNATGHTKLLVGKDNWVFAIQEAQDRQGHWRPIESRGVDFCGNGHWLLKLHPHQLALFFVQQYQGPFVTRLRVRLQNGESRYVSAPYPGHISEQQFVAPAEQMRQLLSNKAAVNWLYYGAKPTALDSIEAREERREYQAFLKKG
jgi:hypothetical protein